MRFFQSLVRRLQSLFNKESNNAALSEELLFHIERQTEENIANGMSPRQARAAARAVFGNIAQATERAYQARGVGWIENFMQDLRYGVRRLHKSRGFTSLVLITLALGITATTTVFSLVNAVLLRPLAFPEPDRLVSLYTLARAEGTSGTPTVRDDTSYPNFFDWRKQNKSFTAMASYTVGGLILGADRSGPARRVAGVQVSADFFNTLGVSPELGRGFTRAEELPGARAVVLSYDTWKTVFAGDRDVLGKTISLSDVSFTIVGVMPRGFAFPVTHSDAAFWISMARDAEGKSPPTEQRGENQLQVIGRLRPGVTLQQAQAEMDSIQQGLAARYPGDDKNEVAVSVIPELQDLVSDVRMPLQILFAAVCCLLLMVCANVAGLMLTRTSQRRGELAIRAALGATRAQILRQLLIESLLLSLSGGTIGLAATKFLLTVIPKLLSADFPRIDQLSMNGEVLAFAIFVSTATGLLFGVLPAWRASRLDPALALTENGRGSHGGRRHYRLQSMLVVSQTAIGLVLLVGAGLLIRSFDRVLNIDPGFSPQQMLTFRLAIPGKGHSREQQISFFHELLARLQSLPGVQMATAAFPLPLTEGDILQSFIIEGRPTHPGDEPSARLSEVESGFFETLRVPLKRGRFFGSSERDAENTPVVIVNEAFAQRYFPGQDAVGQHIAPRFWSADPPFREIVGVVGNVKRGSLTEPAAPEYYVPYEQAPIAIPSVAMRVSGNPDGYAPMVQAAVATLDPTIPIHRLQSYNDDLQRNTAQQRFQAVLMSSFAGLALLLAGVGLYAVLSYMVSQKTTELGVRMALGASRSSVLQLMLLRGLKLAGIGLCGGLGAAALLTQFAAGVLYGVKPLDALTFVSMTLVLLAVSCIASFVPALQASKVDPNVTLRNGN